MIGINYSNVIFSPTWELNSQVGFISRFGDIPRRLSCYNLHMLQSKSVLWSVLTKVELKAKLATDFTEGLSEEEVKRRQLKYGKNTLKEKQKIYFYNRLLKQIKSPLSFILIIAGSITLLLGQYIDTTVIFIAVLINIGIGAFQEERASKAFSRLKKLQQNKAIIIRGGKKFSISANEIVVGDLIVIDAGYSIPADARIVETKGLTINEASLTGEWLPVSKNDKVGTLRAPTADQLNMVWMGTFASSGSATAVVISTGNNTQLGSIAKGLSDESENITPLQKSIKSIAKFLAFTALGALILIFVLGILRGISFFDMFLVSVAIAVAVVPEGLPAAMTVVLAFGMEAILKRKGLVKNLLAAETLGSTTIILTDKTGTLTQAKMRLKSITTISSITNGLKYNPKKNKDERDVLDMAILSTEAFVEGVHNKNTIEEKQIHGNPVEKAILLAGLEYGVTKEFIQETSSEIDYLEFRPENRFSASINKSSSGNKIFITGAPELLLEEAKFVYKGGKAITMTKELRDELNDRYKKLSKEGLRLLATGYKDTKLKLFSENIRNADKEAVEILSHLVFGGFIAFHDPIRSDVKESIKIVSGAGVRVIMATGDQSITASEVAKEVGIENNGIVLTGGEIEKYSDEELSEALKSINILARMLPHQKLRVVNLLKKQGEVVAMTGDGINDAPALQAANIGIALGSGTDVAKEAADMILLDNSFKVITYAIEEGRKMLDNLKKIIAYLLSTSISEIFVVGFALLIGAPLPLLPVQILWTNIIGEGFMNFAFAFEPKEDGIMKRDPRKESMKQIVTPNLKKLILIISLVTSTFLVVLYFFLLSLDLPIEEVRTFMFAALSVSSIFFAFSLKNLHKPIWQINLFSNKYLLFSLSLSISMLMVSLFVAPIQKLLSLTTLSLVEISYILAIGLFNLLVIEITKYWIFSKKRSKLLSLR